MFLVFGTLLQCTVTLCLSGWFCLGAGSGRFALGIFLNLGAEITFSSPQILVPFGCKFKDVALRSSALRWDLYFKLA